MVLYDTFFHLAVNDYTAISDLKVELSESQVSVLVNVNITDDGILEDFERFQISLVLRGPKGSDAVVISPDVVNINIKDNDGKVCCLCELHQWTAVSFLGEQDF